MTLRMRFSSSKVLQNKTNLAVCINHVATQFEAGRNGGSSTTAIFLMNALHLFQNVLTSAKGNTNCERRFC